MGVDVVLVQVSREGSGPKRRRLRQAAVVGDGDDFFARKCQESGMPMLSRVDPYKDLILSSAEMDQFIGEVGALISGTDASGRDRICRILELARQCQNDPNSELHLQGD